MTSRPWTPLTVSAAVAALAACTATPQPEAAPPVTKVSATDTTPLAATATPTGDLVCDALPRATVDLALSGRTVASVDDHGVRRADDLDDGPVLETTCEVYVSGLDTPALGLAVFSARGLPQDVRRQVDGGSAATAVFPDDQVVGLVEELDPRTLAGGGVRPTTHRSRLLVGPVVDDQVDVRVLTITLSPATTGRDTTADVQTLSLQAAQALGLPLLDRAAADTALGPLPTSTPAPSDTNT